jgi:Protein of unknown function (DUF4019)
MRLRLIITIVFLLLFSTVFSRILLADQSVEKVILASADRWLSLVDSGRYDKSWEIAAEFFKKAVPKEQWKRSIAALRQPLGRPLSRKIKSKRRTQILPGATDGQYFIIQFETSFENRKSAVETIIPMLETDNRWRVSRYYIK